MKAISTLAGIIFILLIFLIGCKKEWEEHYENKPETVDRNLWEVIKEDGNLSSFVQYMEDRQLDTLFNKNNSYTLFIPDNEAFTNFLPEDSVTLGVLKYHISNHFIQSSQMGGDKIQMLSEKFVMVENNRGEVSFDGAHIKFESPLYINGKYFILDEVGRPKPNLFEYFEATNPILKTFINSLDSIILDKEKSRPLGFDENGNTIYDTVAIIYNEFEEEFFPVREEFRFKTATIVFPGEEEYNYALSTMAEVMGNIYTDYRDIPYAWQEDILIPYLLENGVFENSLDESEFVVTGAPGDTLKLKNILGDSVIIDYQIEDKAICSNGVAYNYTDFTIPDTLFMGSVRAEAETWLEETGINRFSWIPEIVTVQTDQPYAPLREYIPSASNDSIARVIFNPGYAGRYTLEIKIDNLFSRKYLMVVRTYMNIGGIYNIYFNGELVKTVDYFDYILQPYYYWSVTGKRYFPENGYSYWDAWAINNNEYGDATVKIEYVEPGRITSNGIVIDYIDFIPYDD